MRPVSLVVPDLLLILAQISVEDFDSHRCNGSLSRPVTGFCRGDLSGRELLETACDDVEVRMEAKEAETNEAQRYKISAMKLTLEGKEALWRLADLTQKKLAPIVSQAEQLKRLSGSHDLL